jgi:ribA/ribD-fused uncharacterized protein
MIDSFSGINRWLSNFWPAKVIHLGRTFPNVETAYQASKFNDREVIDYISTLTPGRAKRYASNCPVGRDPSFHFNKIDIMKSLLRQKFYPGGALANMLLATGDQELVEGNEWGDTFWGVCGGIGENNLGKLLMNIRDELQSNSTKSVNQK